MTVSHAYQAAGQYRVVVTVADTAGNVTIAERTVTVAALPVVQSPPPPLSSPGPNRLIRLRTVKLTNRKTVRVRAVCVAKAQGSCRGILVLSSRVQRSLLRGPAAATQKPRFKTVILAKKNLSIPAGKAKTLNVRLNKTARKLTAKLGTRKLKRLKVTVKAKVSDQTGHTTTTKKTVKLPAPKRKSPS